MTRAWALTLLLAGCGAGAGIANPFPGTCLEPLYACFRASGAGVCGYDSATRVATLTFPSGARIESASGGAGANRCFGPSGTICFTVTQVDAATRNYNGQGQDVNVIDQGGSTVEVRCPGAAPRAVPKPTYNPATEDLRRCVPSP
jgi:hypothetical protein